MNAAVETVLRAGLVEQSKRHDALCPSNRRGDCRCGAKQALLTLMQADLVAESHC